MHVANLGAGLKDGYIKTSSGTQYDIYAIVSIEGNPKQDETEIKGDDQILATFISNQREDIMIKANGVNFETLQAITGNQYASSSGGVEIALGTDAQISPVSVEVGAYTRAQDANKVALTIEKIWHSVQITGIKVSQAGDKEFNIELKGSAYKTATDITGEALTTARVASLRQIY